MFDYLPDLDALGAVDDAALVGAIEGWARACAATDARRLAAIGELARRRRDAADRERSQWVCDWEDSVAAEVACALRIGHGWAGHQVTLSLAVWQRFPKLAALFEVGEVTAWMLDQVVERALLVVDAEVDAYLDAELAEQSVHWGRLSKYKLLQSIDRTIGARDPAAVRHAQSKARSRDVTIGDPDPVAGTTPFWGRLYSTDASLLGQKLTAMTRGVCKDDPRTQEQRRADALGALAADANHLACLCGSDDCPAARDDGRATRVSVHIMADPAVLTARPDAAMNGHRPDEPDEDQLSEQASEATRGTAAPTATTMNGPPAPAGIISGGGIVPASLLRELIDRGAKVRFVGMPGGDAAKCYRIPAAMAEFVRCRDVTCRFPGCDRPAEHADIDHTVPWPAGATHPSNLKTYCRKHHLLKTFWGGVDGWADRQLPDGTVLITSPTGITYSTKPGSALLFPGWNTTTGDPPPGPTSRHANTSGITMPHRKRTRAQDRAYRIQVERAANQGRLGDGPPY